jgi:hypothetical protein
MQTQVRYLFTAVILLLMPPVHVAQAPDLGTTSHFALFTAAGAVNKQGATATVTGDVGTNGGTFNAFPAETFIGDKPVADLASVQAATDGAIAYRHLMEVTFDQIL